MLHDSEHEHAVGRGFVRDQTWRWNGRVSKLPTKPHSFGKESLTGWLGERHQSHNWRNHKNGLAKRGLRDTVAFLCECADDDLVACFPAHSWLRTLTRTDRDSFFHSARCLRAIRETTLLSRRYSLCLAFPRFRHDLARFHAMKFRPSQLLSSGKATALLLALVSRPAAAGSILARKWTRTIFERDRDN